MSKRYHIAVVGATGAVGVEMFRVLERRGFPVASIRAFSSKRSAGKFALFHDEKIPVAELAPDSFQGIDLALFSAGTAVARFSQATTFNPASGICKVKRSPSSSLNCLMKKSRRSA